MGLTSLRRHNLRAQPVPEPPRRSHVPFEQHQLALQEQAKQYEQKLSELRSTPPGAPEGPTDADMRAAVERIKELEDRVQQLQTENAELEELLEQATGGEPQDGTPGTSPEGAGEGSQQLQTENAEPPPKGKRSGGKRGS